jgi:hypothetical protein
MSNENNLFAIRKREANRISKQKSRLKLYKKVPLGIKGKLVSYEYISQKNSEYFKSSTVLIRLKRTPWVLIINTILMRMII